MVSDDRVGARRPCRVPAANVAECDFPLENLPYGVFSVAGSTPRVGIAIGDQILDMSVLENGGALDLGTRTTVFHRPAINAFMALGQRIWTRTRQRVTDLLAADSDLGASLDHLVETALVPMRDAVMRLPIAVSEYTDFYSSMEHATNVGALFRDPANALPANWLHVPIGYNGRASTVVVSGTDIRRPLGQIAGPGGPRFEATRRLDFELELGAIVGAASIMGERVSVGEAHDMIFGYVLLNDWSARDIQTWEGQPLGPFQSKAFATTIGAWVVTAEALEPFRVPTPARIEPLLPYLRESAAYNFDLDLEVRLLPAGLGSDHVLCRTNQRHLYYSPPQQLAHHASSGCAMNIGDLLGSGTISGRERGTVGSLLEMTRNGQEPLSLPGAVERTFLEDGDTIALAGHCQARDYRIGFGPCTGKIVPGQAYSQR